jgi:hypothetical protein
MIIPERFSSTLFLSWGWQLSQRPLRADGVGCGPPLAWSGVGSGAGNITEHREKGLKSAILKPLLAASFE